MSLFNQLFGLGDAQTQSEAEANIARQQEALREQARRDGTVDETEQYLSRVGGAEDVGAAWRSGFGEGLQDGINNEKSFVNRFFTGVLGAVPWSVWVVAGLALFWWAGGFVWLARKSKGVLK